MSIQSLLQNHFKTILVELGKHTPLSEALDVKHEGEWNHNRQLVINEVMIWLVLMLLWVPFLSLSEILEDKEQLTSRCNVILNPNANQTQRDFLRQGRVCNRRHEGIALVAFWLHF